MTSRRIYILGDLGDLPNVKIFNADTNQRIEVANMKLILNPKLGPEAAMYLATDPRTPVYADIVPAPPVKHAGKVLREVELTVERRRDETINRATMTEWEVQPDGTVRPNTATRAYYQHAVADTTLVYSGAHAKDILEDSVRLVLTDIAQHMVTPLMSTGATPLQTGGPVGYTPGPGLPVTSKKSQPGKLNSNSRAVCSECGDTGEYISQITGKKSNCSQGCKRP